ncbi:MAG: TldD/PmbA family protein, partial [Dehalococcoidia bacterium]
MPKVTIDAIADIRSAVHDLIRRYPRSLRYCRYADLRIEASQGKAAVAENGMDKHSAEDYGFSFGVRVIAGEGVAAPGYFGQTLGSADLPKLSRLLRAGIDHAYRRALANAQRKAGIQGRLGPLAEALYDSALASVDVREDTVAAHYRRDPRAVPLEEVTTYVREVSQAVGGLDQKVVFNYVYGGTMLIRQLFCSTDGANIDQSWALSEGMAYVVAQGKEGGQELYDFIGHQRGWEVVTGGVAEEYIQMPDLMTFATGLARDTVALANARPCPATDEEVVVVTDPHYNALVCHEVVGHPTELDRALK